MSHISEEPTDFVVVPNHEEASGAEVHDRRTLHELAPHDEMNTTSIRYSIPRKTPLKEDTKGKKPEVVGSVDDSSEEDSESDSSQDYVPEDETNAFLQSLRTDMLSLRRDMLVLRDGMHTNHEQILQNFANLRKHINAIHSESLAAIHLNTTSHAPPRPSRPTKYASTFQPFPSVEHGSGQRRTSTLKDPQPMLAVFPKPTPVQSATGWWTPPPETFADLNPSLQRLRLAERTRQVPEWPCPHTNPLDTLDDFMDQSPLDEPDSPGASMEATSGGGRPWGRKPTASQSPEN